MNFYVIVVGRNLHPSAEEYVLPNNAYSFLDNCQSKKCLMIFLLDISLIFLKYQIFFWSKKENCFQYANALIYKLSFEEQNKMYKIKITMCL